MSEYTISDLHARIGELVGDSSWAPPAAFGMGIARISDTSEGPKVLDTYFPSINRDENNGFAALLCDVLKTDPRSGTIELTPQALADLTAVLQPIYDSGEEGHPNAELVAILNGLSAGSTNAFGARVVPVFTMIENLDDAPIDAHDAYLRLHLISSRRVQPHGCSLDGVFGLLNNVCWTNHGPADPVTFESYRAGLAVAGESVNVFGVDKFPRMIDYVVPSGVRIADADRVRLGAHLAEGTTVMHEGFVNFNAGTLGAAMVEGRISAGVVLGADSDLGGGASVMGTLSGGGKEVISVGSGCLVGANAGLGISLGDNCVVEAGLYVTAGTLVTLPDGEVVKAKELARRNDLLFRRNSQSGAVEVIARGETWAGLNSELHSND